MSVKNNKVYKDVLKELEKGRKLSQYVTYKNALINIKYSTEDEKLIGLIDAYIERFVDIEDCAKNRNYSRAEQLYKYSLVYKIELEDYCREIIKSGKPEWMVCAEANGWRYFAD